MTSFVTLHRGDSVSNAKVVAVSCDPSLIALVANCLLQDPKVVDPAPADPVTDALNTGRRRALRLVTTEAKASARKGAQL